MKVLLVNGSPRIGGNSDTLVKKLEESASQLDITCSELKLRECYIKHCTGCDLCHKESGKCGNKDDFSKSIFSMILEFQALYLISPVYQGGVTGLMKDFMDRCEMFRHGRLLKNKLCGGAVIGGYAGGGQELTLMQIQYFAHICAMRYIASWGKTRSHLGGHCIAYGRKEVEQDTDGMISCKNVLIEMVNAYAN